MEIAVMVNHDSQPRSRFVNMKNYGLTGRTMSDPYKSIRGEIIPKQVCDCHPASRCRCRRFSYRSFHNAGLRNLAVGFLVLRTSEPDLPLIPQPEEPKKSIETIEAVKSRYARKRSQYPQYAQQSQEAKISFLHCNLSFDCLRKLFSITVRGSAYTFCRSRRGRGSYGRGFCLLG